MSEPKQASTSHAHGIDPVKDGTLGENSKTLNDQFAKAKAAQLQKQAAAKSAPAPDMSFARSVDPVNDNKLANASQTMRGQHERASAVPTAKPQPSNENLKGPAPSPGLHNKPGGQLQKDVDRPIHNQAMADYAKKLNEAAKARQAGQNQSSKANEKGKDLDRGR